MFTTDADIINKAPRDITKLTMGDIEIDQSQTLIDFLNEHYEAAVGISKNYTDATLAVAKGYTDSVAGELTLDIGAARSYTDTVAEGLQAANVPLLGEEDTLSKTHFNDLITKLQASGLMEAPVEPEEPEEP